MKDCHINLNWLNIDSVVENDLCSQCGACEAMCPHDNIIITRDKHMRFYPKVTEISPCIEKCKNLCVDVCSGVHEDTSLWKDKSWIPENYDEYCNGTIESVWIGYAKDKAIRSRGTSGGLVTGLLVYLLESGKIDGVLLVGSNDKKSLEHDIIVAKTRAEIENAWGSKYYPMPIASKFSEMMEFDKKYAVVLLGCHMRSLRLMESKIKRLKTNIILRIGLICGYCSGFKGMEDQALEWEIDDFHDAKRIDYREGKWPGNVRIETPTMTKKRSIYEFLERLPFTTNHRCLVCSDLMNETADIAVGDAWLRELTTKKDEGWSVIAVRNIESSLLIADAVRDGALYLEEADKETFVRSQEKPMRYKKHALKVRYWYTKNILRQPLPNYNFQKNDDGFPVNFWNILGNVLFMFTQSVFFKRDRMRRMMYRFVPKKMLSWYVKSIFLMIAHDGRGSFVKKWLFKKEPALNCDA